VSDAAAAERPWKTAFLLCLFAGFLGAHRFYVGRKGSGLAQLVTFGGCGLWSAYDLYCLWSERFEDGGGRALGRA
jgi:TM2 domain-containing membrane protein YozV